MSDLERAILDRKIPREVAEFLGTTAVLVIDGTERAALGGATFKTVDPATEEVLAEVARGGPDDVSEAVGAARAAFDDGRWSRVVPRERARILHRVADLVERDARSIAWIETLDGGKPLVNAEREVALAAACFRYYAGWTDKVVGETVPVRPQRLVYSLREPVGVCGQIIPWNFPIVMAAWKIAPALAFGNTVVLKPAEQTPLSALWLQRLLAEAEVPDGVVNLIQGLGNETGAPLVADPRVDKVTFTGSTEVGREIMRSSAEHLHKVTLELGGKSPNIVFPDADLAAAAQIAVLACFRNSGQICTAATRLLVPRARHDELVERVATGTGELRVGPGWLPNVQLGPVVSGEQLERVERYVGIGKSEGAEVVAGGTRVADEPVGYYYQPTVFDGVAPEHRIAQEEIFGPVLVIQDFDDEDEAVALANGVPYGLAAGIWTRDLARAHRVAAALRAGVIWVNTYGEFDDAVSFGGYKGSGFGRELGRHSIETYTQTKHVWVATDTGPADA